MPHSPFLSLHGKYVTPYTCRPNNLLCFVAVSCPHDRFTLWFDEIHSSTQRERQKKAQVFKGSNGKYLKAEIKLNY